MTTFIVENPLAPQAIGDTIASFAALHAAAWESPADVYLAAVACRELLSHPQITLLGDRPDHGTVLNIQELFTQYAGTGTSMTRAYLHAAGLHLLANQQRSPEVILGVGLGEEPQDRFDFLIAPFSASDNGTQTKVWSDQGWQFLIRTLTEHGQRVGILGGPQDNTSALGDSCLGKNGGGGPLGVPVTGGLPDV